MELTAKARVASALDVHGIATSDALVDALVDAAHPPFVVQFFTISQYGTPRRFIKDEPFKTEVSRLLGTKSVTVSDMNHIRALFAVAGVELKFKEVPAYEGIPA